MNGWIIQWLTHKAHFLPPTGVTSIKCQWKIATTDSKFEHTNTDKQWEKPCMRTAKKIIKNNNN